MKSLYITSVERYIGKTATCLAIGAYFQTQGYQIGYLKPLSLQPWLRGGKVADEDAAFVKEVLGLAAEPWELSPVVLTPEFLRQHLADPQDFNLMGKVQESFNTLSQGVDLMLLEGGGNMREGYVVGLPTINVAKTITSKVLAIVRYRDEVQMLDDVLAVHKRLGDILCGVIINRVPDEANTFVTQSAAPFIERKGIAVLGILPDERSLSALTVGELIDLLKADVLTRYLRREAMIDNMTVGAMTADTALSRFRHYSNKAVITGGDRTDIQLAALETSTTCLILTGNLRPSPLVVKQAEEFGVSILLVRTNTMETIEAIDRIYGKTRLGQKSKLAQFQNLMEKHCDFKRLAQFLDLH